MAAGVNPAFSLTLAPGAELATIVA